jgi:hypothetical protein
MRMFCVATEHKAQPGFPRPHQMSTLLLQWCLLSGVKQK